MKRYRKIAMIALLGFVLSGCEVDAGGNDGTVTDLGNDTGVSGDTNTTTDTGTTNTATPVSANPIAHGCGALGRFSGPTSSASVAK